MAKLKVVCKENLRNNLNTLAFKITLGLFTNPDVLLESLQNLSYAYSNELEEDPEDVKIILALFKVIHSYTDKVYGKELDLKLFLEDEGITITFRDLEENANKDLKEFLIILSDYRKVKFIKNGPKLSGKVLRQKHENLEDVVFNLEYENRDLMEVLFREALGFEEDVDEFMTSLLTPEGIIAVMQSVFIKYVTEEYGVGCKFHITLKKDGAYLTADTEDTGLIADICSFVAILLRYTDVFAVKRLSTGKVIIAKCRATDNYGNTVNHKLLGN